MRKELLSRVIGALAFFFVLLLFVYVLDPAWFIGLVAAILAIACIEWAALCGFGDWRWRAAAATAGALLAILGHAWLEGLRGADIAAYERAIQLAALALSLFWLLVSAWIAFLIVRRAPLPPWPISKLSLGARVLALAGGLALLAPCLWFVDYIFLQEGLGRLLLIFFLGICIMMDVMAFFSGKTLGRHRLCPNISANKTVEGLGGGAVAAALWVLALWLNFLGGSLPEWFFFAMAAVIVVAVAGDLFESIVKRLAEVKDSGRIVYGHGGMLDRIDSMIAAAPVFTLALSLAV